MDGWMDGCVGCMHVYMDGCTDGWIDGYLYACLNGCILEMSQ